MSLSFQFHVVGGTVYLDWAGEYPNDDLLIVIAGTPSSSNNPPVLCRHSDQFSGCFACRQVIGRMSPHQKVTPISSDMNVNGAFIQQYGEQPFGEVKYLEVIYPSKGKITIDQNYASTYQLYQSGTFAYTVQEGGVLLIDIYHANYCHFKPSDMAVAKLDKFSTLQLIIDSYRSLY